jgi:hypothetical protein
MTCDMFAAHLYTPKQNQQEGDGVSLVLDQAGRGFGGRHSGPNV